MPPTPEVVINTASGVPFPSNVPCDLTMLQEHEHESALEFRSAPGGSALARYLKARIDSNIPLPSAPPVLVQTRGTTQQIQSELWKRHTLHKLSLSAKLREIGETAIAAGLEHCHTEYTIGQCKGCSSVSKFPNRCDRFYCPECQPRLSKERADSVGWWAQEMKQPKHVVLTMKNTKDLTKGHVLEIKKNFTRLRRSIFASNWLGGFYNIEVTKESEDWHLHIHALVEARFIDRSLLEENWKRITNGIGYIVRVYDARERDYLKEVTKYAVKGSQLSAWTGKESLTFIEAFSGVKSFGVFGSLYGKRTEWREWINSGKTHGKICDCGCSEYWYFTELEWQAADCKPDLSTASIPPPTADFLNFEFSF